MIPGQGLHKACVDVDVVCCRRRVCLLAYAALGWHFTVSILVHYHCDMDITRIDMYASPKANQHLGLEACIGDYAVHDRARCLGRQEPRLRPHMQTRYIPLCIPACTAGASCGQH